MCTILLPIKPKYSNKILDGSKKFEFRKNIPTRKVDKIIIYSSYPEKNIVGEVEVLGIISEDISKLWEKTKKFSGISKKDFMLYYADKDKGFAYILGDVKKYKESINLNNIGVKYSPQSFIYADKYVDNLKKVTC